MNLHCRRNWKDKIIAVLSEHLLLNIQGYPRAGKNLILETPFLHKGPKWKADLDAGFGVLLRGAVWWEKDPYERGLGWCQKTLPVESRGVGFQASVESQMMGTNLKQREITPVIPPALRTRAAMVFPLRPHCLPGPVWPSPSPLHGPLRGPPSSQRPGPELRSGVWVWLCCSPVLTAA